MGVGPGVGCACGGSSGGRGQAVSTRSATPSTASFGSIEWVNLTAATALFFGEPEDRQDDAQRSENRHHSGRHPFMRAEKFRGKLTREREGKNEAKDQTGLHLACTDEVTRHE